MLLKSLKIGIPAISIAGIFIYVFHINILVGIGQFLIDVDEPENVEVAFVLGGNSFDRGTKGFELYSEGFCQKIVCLGGNTPSIFTSIGIDKKESQISGEHIINNLGAPNHVVEMLQEGTSTMEESDIVLEYALKNNLEKIIVVSDKFHTNRIRGVFDEKFEEKGIEVLLIGTPSSQYDEENWWKSESGLIMLNNEYVKTLYYMLKY